MVHNDLHCVHTISSSKLPRKPQPPGNELLTQSNTPSHGFHLCHVENAQNPGNTASHNWLCPPTGGRESLTCCPRAQGLGESRSVSCLHTPSSLLNAHSLWDQPADTAVGAETAGTTGAGRHHSLSDCSPRPARALGLALTGEVAALCVCPCLFRDGHRTRSRLGTSVLLGLLVSDRLSPPSPGPQEPGSLWTIPELQRGKGHHPL